MKKLFAAVLALLLACSVYLYCRAAAQTVVPSRCEVHSNYGSDRSDMEYSFSLDSRTRELTVKSSSPDGGGYRHHDWILPILSAGNRNSALALGLFEESGETMPVYLAFSDLVLSGRVIRYSFDNGNYYQFARNSRNQVTKITGLFVDFSGTKSARKSIAFSYNTDGTVNTMTEEQRYPDDSDADALIRTYRCRYQDHRMVSCEYRNNNELMQNAAYRYNASSNLTRMTIHDAGGNRTRTYDFTYSGQHLTRIAFTDSDYPGRMETSRYSYRNGKLQSIRYEADTDTEEIEFQY